MKVWERLKALWSEWKMRDGVHGRPGTDEQFREWISDDSLLPPLPRTTVDKYTGETLYRCDECDEYHPAGTVTEVLVVGGKKSLVCESCLEAGDND